MLQSLLQEFLLSRVSFSVINAAQTLTVLVHIVGVFAQQITASVKRRGLQAGPIVLLTDLLLLSTEALMSQRTPSPALPADQHTAGSQAPQPVSALQSECVTMRY